jgi:uncharacterized protein (TIGR03435 family)
MRVSSLSLALCFAVIVAPCPAQTSSAARSEAAAPATKPSFEVASIRPNERWKYSPPGYSLDSDEDFVAGQPLFVADASLAALIAFAYKLNSQYSMLTSLPKWATTQSVHISARVPGSPTKDQVRDMMKTLLSERLHLELHFEKQEKSVFALTLIRKDELGPGLHHFASCKVEGTPPKKGDQITNLDWLPCSVYLALDQPGGAVFVASRNTTMNQLCAFLSSVGGFGRMVIDRSDVTGPIDFGLTYRKDALSTAEDDSASSSEPLEAALKSQLGLKLIPMRAVVDVPIVDRIDPMTDN